MSNATEEAVTMIRRFFDEKPGGTLIASFVPGPRANVSAAFRHLAERGEIEEAYRSSAGNKVWRAATLTGTEIESEVGPVTVAAVRGGKIIATEDGEDVDRSGWCECDHDGEVFYTVRGTTSAGEPMLDNRLTHGWACGGCRKIRQTG